MQHKGRTADFNSVWRTSTRNDQNERQVFLSNLIQNTVSAGTLSQLHPLRPTKTSSKETPLEKDNKTEEGQTKDKKKKKKSLWWGDVKSSRSILAGCTTSSH